MSTQAPESIDSNTRIQRLTAHNAELEQRLARAILDLDELRNDKVLSQHRSNSPASTASLHHRSTSSISRPLSLSLSASTSANTSYGGEEMMRALSAGSSAHHNTSWDNTPDEQRRPGYNKRRSVGSNHSLSLVGAGALPSSGHKIPFGRGHSRRSLSIDVSQLNLDQRDPSPTRPLSAMSINSSTDEHAQPTRRNRHHRPLSLSLGPSLFARVPEGDAFTASPTAEAFSRRSSYSGPMTRRPSNTVPTSASGESGLNTWIESPVKQRTQQRAVLVDAETQTDAPPPRPTMHSTPKQFNLSSSSGNIFSDFALDPAGITQHSSFSIDGSPSLEDADDALGHSTRPGSIETRTAALPTLIEHASKLLSRVQTADVTSQERRLKKQNLPGNVRHVAQANLKDLLHDIEGLRSYFRVLLEQERAHATQTAGSQTELSLVMRKDFVGLVKLLRDLLFELSRLRALVNKVELDPATASTLRNLDESNVADVIAARPGAGATSGGLLAPLSRLWSSTSGSSHSSGSASSDIDPNHLAPVTPRSNSASRQLPKREGSAAVSSATVNVEFGAGIGGGRAVATGVAGQEGTDVGGSPSSGRASQKSPASVSAVRNAPTAPPVRRDLSSIFAGGALPPKADPWVVLPAHTPPAQATHRGSLNPFGRLLSGFPTSFTNSLTTNAITDSFQRAPSTQQPPADHAVPPTLLQRQLRPRGNSDSSIRSTFTTHGLGLGVESSMNPHHRILTKAGVAPSAGMSAVMAEATAIGVPGSGSGAAGGGSAGLKAQLTELSVSRKPSSPWLRPNSGGPSNSSSRSNSPAPPSPLTPTFSISPSPDPAGTSPASRAVSISPPRAGGSRSSSTDSSRQPNSSSPTGAIGSPGMFSSFSSWAAGKAGLGIAGATATDSQETLADTVHALSPAAATPTAASPPSRPMTISASKGGPPRVTSAERAASRRTSGVDALGSSLSRSGRMA